jgi:hypothetical protein
MASRCHHRVGAGANRPSEVRHEGLRAIVLVLRPVGGHRHAEQGLI